MAGMPLPDLLARGGDYVFGGKTHCVMRLLPFDLTQMVGKVLEYFVSNSIDIFETINRHPLKTAP